MDSSWIGAMAPWIDNALMRLATIDTPTWILAAGLLIVLAIALSVRAGRQHLVSVVRRLSGESRQYAVAIENLRGEHTRLVEDIRNLKLTHDDSKLAFIADLLEKLTDQERDRRQHVSALDESFRRLTDEVQDLQARIADLPIIATGGSEPSAQTQMLSRQVTTLAEELTELQSRVAELPGIWAATASTPAGVADAGASNPAPAPQLATLSAEIGNQKARIDQLDLLISRLAELRID